VVLGINCAGLVELGFLLRNVLLEFLALLLLLDPQLYAHGFYLFALGFFLVALVSLLFSDQLRLLHL
jgi:uncharacterized membrane protein